MWKPEDGIVILILTSDKTTRRFRDGDRYMFVDLLWIDISWWWQ